MFVLLGHQAPSSRDPRDPSGGRKGVALHCGALRILLDAAERHGFADLPLHRLGIRPTSGRDPILDLPQRIGELDERGVSLLVERNQRAFLMAIRAVVEMSLPGLADSLPTYQSLPWHVEVVAEVRAPGVVTYRKVERNVGETDSVTVTVGAPADRSILGGWTSVGPLRSVQEGVYRALTRDANSLLSGERALGRASL
jgi:hypothetical protein